LWRDVFPKLAFELSPFRTLKGEYGPSLKISIFVDQLGLLAGSHQTTIKTASKIKILDTFDLNAGSFLANGNDAH